MALYTITKVGSSLVIKLIVTSGDYIAENFSFKSPSLKQSTDKIKFSESGQYVTNLKLHQISTINSVAPTSLTDAFDKIITLIG